MTLAELKTQIEGDLHRTDISAQVSTAISGAIAHYSKKDSGFGRASDYLCLGKSDMVYGPYGLESL